MRAIVLCFILGLGLASCSYYQFPSVDRVPAVADRIPEPVLNRKGFRPDAPSVVRLPSEMVVEEISLDHRLDSVVIPSRLRLNGTYTLEEVANLLSSAGIPAICEENCYVRVNCNNETISGVYSLRKFLDDVSVQAGVFWTVADGGVIRFTGEALVVYRFPFLSKGVFRAVYRMTEDDDFIDDIKNSIFKEIEKGLTEVIFPSVLKKERVVKWHSGINTEKSSEGEKAKLEETSGKKVSNKTDKENKTKYSKESDLVVEDVEKKSKEGADSESGYENKKFKDTPFDLRSKVSNRQESSNSRKNISSEKEELGKETETTGSREEVREAKQLQTTKGREKQKLIGKLYTREEEHREIKQVYDGKKKIAVLPRLGLVVVRVSSLGELGAIRSFIKSVIDSVLGRLVLFDVYVIEISQERSVNVKSALDALWRNNRYELGTSIKEKAMNFVWTTLSTNYLSGIAKGYSLSFLVNLIVNAGNGRIVSSTTVSSLPRMLARIKSTVGIPYLEPEDVSVGGTNPTQSYEVKYIEDGTEIRLSPSVLGGEDLLVAVSVYINQYLGDKEVKVGQFGVFTLPIQSPKVLSTVFRCRPGDVILLGGMKKVSVKKARNFNFVLPDDLGNSKQSRELYILVRPRLVVFGGKNGNVIESRYSNFGRIMIDDESGNKSD